MTARARLLILGLTLIGMGAHAADKAHVPAWPLKYVSASGVATVYQPQLESFKDNRLTGRCAVSVKLTGDQDPWFGAVWLEGRVVTDRDTGLVTVTSVKVTDVKAPEASPNGFAALKKFLSEQLTQSQFVIPLSQLTASLEGMGKTGNGSPDLSTAPPEILFRTKPAVLVIMDGDPKTQSLDGGKLLQVINTAEVLVQDPPTSAYFLWTDGGWIGAASLSGPWNVPATVPPAVEAMGKTLVLKASTAKKEGKAAKGVPEVIIRKGPAELFVTEGEPQYEPLKGVSLLYVTNSDQNILMDIDDQGIYVVASGRWYKSKKTDGPWTYVPSDKLPAGFAQIPADSPMAGVRVFVAGTPESREAVLDASVPQTASVKQGPADVKVSYAGPPQWKTVDGMGNKDVSYAENTSDAIFKVKDRYYLCKDAVWYLAAKPEGPWSVAVTIPPELNKLPPSCPNYQCSYVYIYESTPDTVYVGYTAGYMGCFIFGASIMYGTGYYYPPYYGYGAYYARPMTYGYHAYYNPATGWGAVGYRGPNGGISVSGPVGGWGPGQRPGGPGGIGGPGRPGHPVGGRPTPKSNLYNQPGRVGAAVEPATRRSSSADRLGSMPSPAGGKNNVYADPNGNVYRQNSNGSWDSRSNGQWSQSRGSLENHSDLQRQSEMRQRSFDRGSFGGGGFGGGMRGGGGRRR